MSTDVSKCDQVVFECMQKVAEIIVQSRVLQKQKRFYRDMNSKFYLHVEELEFVRHSMDAWKPDLHMPLGIDVFWQEHKQGDGAPSVELLERWEIVYEAQDSVGSKSAQLRHMCKRAIILLRTLYSLVRMVPAYQVHRRLQKAFDGKDRARVEEQDDMGFCLYPILDRGGGGSGLSFPAVPAKNNASVVQGEKKDSTGCYSFKPLEAPHGTIKIKVAYRRGLDPKACLNDEALTNPTSSMAANMTTSIIQDYVPDEYANNQIRHIERDTSGRWVKGVDGEKQQNYSRRLATMPEDGATTPYPPSRTSEDVEREDGVGGMSGLGVALLRHDVDNSSVVGGTSSASLKASRNKQSPDYNADLFGATALGSPEQGHGYADGRVHKLKEHGPAPFLTPGPHGHKLVRSGSQGHITNMEPLDLGPNAGAHAGERPRPVVDSLLRSPGGRRYLVHKDQERYGDSKREWAQPPAADHSGGARAEARSLDTHGSLEEYTSQRGRVQPKHRDNEVPAQISRQWDFARSPCMTVVAGLERDGAPRRSNYRRNSISEAPMGPRAALPYEQALLSVMQDHSHHSTPTVSSKRAVIGSSESTPPFSYYEDVNAARHMSQPLVSFSPPFDASPLTPGGYSQIPRSQRARSDEASLLQVGSGLEARGHGGRTSLMALAGNGSPAILETLPESPFSSNVRTSLGTGRRLADTTTTSSQFSASLVLPIRDGRSISTLGNAVEIGDAAGQVDSLEGLPFAVFGDTGLREETADGREQESIAFDSESENNLTRTMPPSALFALCSVANSKSILLAQESLPSEPGLLGPLFPAYHHHDQRTQRGADSSTAYMSGTIEFQLAQDAEKTVRSLEEELDGFRQFHQELGGMRP